MAEGSSAPKKKYNHWKQGGGQRGRGGGNRGGSAGRGRGGGGSRGGFSRGGGRGGRGGFSAAGRGVDDDDDERAGPKMHHLGRYRDSPLPEMMLDIGIMATAVQNKERSAEREFIECLERVADELYPETIESEVKTKDGDQDVDLEEMLKRELAGMSVNNKSNRFRLCLHETTCVFYVVCLPPLDPVRIVHHILSQTERTARCPFRFLQRIVPITAVANATLPSLKTAAKPVIEKGFTTPTKQSLKFGIMVNTRSSSKLDRMDMIHALAEMVTDVDKGHKVDLKDQERTLLVELHKGRVGASVVEDYFRFAKYNAIQLAEQTASKDKSANKATQSHDQTEPSPDSNEKDTEGGSSVTTPKISHAAQKHAKRDRRAEQIAGGSSPRKRSFSDVKNSEQEEGETEDDGEEGEVREGDLKIGEGGNKWDETIAEGKVTKVRRVEDIGGDQAS